MSIKDYETELRNGQKALLQTLYPADYKKLKIAAKTLDIDFERARQARQYGKGSTVTINGLILEGLGLTPKDLKKSIPKIREFIANPLTSGRIEELTEEALMHYNENELIAWLRLLIARAEIEVEVGVRKN